MNRLQKKQRSFGFYYSAAVYLRNALVAFDRAVKAENGNVKRKAGNEAKESLFAFCSCIYQTEGSLSKALRVVAKALDGKLRFKPVRYNDYIEEAVAAIFGGRNEVRFLMKDPFSLRQFKRELARLYGVTPKELTKLTQREKDRKKNKTYEEELKKKPSDTKHPNLFDSSLRRTLERRGYRVSANPAGQNKLPRLQRE